jgi:glycerol-3-phosphate O-acyltransferase
MIVDTEPLVYLLVLALLALLAVLHVRRRLRTGEATEIERRHEQTLRRFRVEIDHFKFTRQQFVKVMLNHDHAIGTHIEELAGADGTAREGLRLKVHDYVDEIVPFFKPLTYYGVGLRAARLVLNALYRIDYRESEVARIKAYTRARPRSVVYLMNHRSNVDYVLAAYVLAEKIALSFAVGEWARVWPLEYLFKSFGSYFLRRGERDPLYHAVLKRYVQLVTKSGVTQALFPEGGLSRDGRLRAPKIGLLDYIVCAKEDRSFQRELVFVPVAINYDRVLEDRALTRELGGATRPERRPAMAREALRILSSNARKLSRRQLTRHGIAAVRFGEPVSFDEWQKTLGVDLFALDKETRRRHVASFCNELTGRIARLVPATPVAVVATVLVSWPALGRGSLEHHVAEAVHRLTARGVEVVGAENGAAWLCDVALALLQSRHLLREVDGALALDPAQRRVVQYYANSIAHHEDGYIPEVEAPVPRLPADRAFVTSDVLLDRPAHLRA